MCEYVYVPVCLCVYKLCVCPYTCPCVHTYTSLMGSGGTSAGPRSQDSMTSLWVWLLYLMTSVGNEALKMEDPVLLQLRQSYWTQRVHMARFTFKLCPLPPSPHKMCRGLSSSLLSLGYGVHVSRLWAQCLGCGRCLTSFAFASTFL